MARKLLIAAAGAVGYVLGAKAGRERYDQIRDQARRVWRDPRVQEKASQATDTVKDTAEQVRDKVPAAKERITEQARHAAGKVNSSSGSATPDGASDPATGASGGSATPSDTGLDTTGSRP